ncbi:hypothetical protein Glove_668g16 [Diversispora epigaea]|uniref:Uncharacterized protein n=1 Tax=Diversispora epigaea TaxID=1348612 RepID=A0A397G7P5_9GLOM|nr:hypothetical protein Glove_668g16 [Diversispora epigaea]
MLGEWNQWPTRQQQFHPTPYIMGWHLTTRKIVNKIKYDLLYCSNIEFLFMALPLVQSNPNPGITLQYLRFNPMLGEWNQWPTRQQQFHPTPYIMGWHLTTRKIVNKIKYDLLYCSNIEFLFMALPLVQSNPNPGITLVAITKAKTIHPSIAPYFA